MRRADLGSCLALAILVAACGAPRAHAQATSIALPDLNARPARPAAAVTAPGAAQAPAPAATAAAQQAGAPQQAPPAPEATIQSGAVLAGPGMGLEGAISELSYRLGPGDVLTVSVWSASPLVYDLPVTVEGRLVVPGAGEIDARGMLLKDARAEVLGRLARQYRNVQVTVALTVLRRFQIHVLGEVVRPGTYLGTAADRVSSAIAWAGGLTGAASSRRILVTRSDSTRAVADIFAFLRRGIARTNPWLQDGDVIYVPFAREHFGVEGAVNRPGDFELVEGDRFHDALTLAEGFTAETTPDSVEIARYPGPGRGPIRFFALADGRLLPARPEDGAALPAVIGAFPVPGTAAAAGAAAGAATASYPDFALAPNDVIFVRSIPESRIRRLVEVEGEVLHPGAYAIDEGRTRLSELIRRAGGVTPDAFLEDAKLIRHAGIDSVDVEFQRLKTMLRSSMTDDEYEYFKMRSRETPGQVTVDFVKLLAGGDEGQDRLLRGGDVIRIPAGRNFVHVLGMVVSPGEIAYDGTLEKGDYVRLAGGYAEHADRRKARVIRAGSETWVSFGKVDRVEPGDTIWVPEKQPRSWWGAFKDVLGVATQIATVYAVVRAINK